ncbi:hypothetical protein [Rhizobium sp. ZPR3]|uniref:Uncharacterized protein n=2 Tax=unclassified Rhizobium TaxID=2613769 RepID=A0AAU7SRZ2_9HYPH
MNVTAMKIPTDKAQDAVDKLNHISEMIVALLATFPPEAPAARELLKEADTQVRRAKFEIVDVHNAHFLAMLYRS